MPEKAVYSLTRQGEQEFEKLMLKIAERILDKSDLQYILLKRHRAI